MADGGGEKPARVTASGVAADSAAIARSNLRGILAMTAACASFACGDTIMKLVAGHLPTSELIFIRGVFVLLGAGIACLYLGAFSIVHRAVSKAMAVRAAADSAGAWSFQLALARMPYAELSAIGQLTPLAITAASALLFGDKVGWRRWTATIVGLGGVLLIIRPGSSAASWWALAGLAAVIASTVRDLSTRRVDSSVPAPMITLFSAGLTVATSGIVAAAGGWTSPPAMILLGLVAAAGFSLLGQTCTIIAVRAAEVAVVVPFRYTIILFAILSGFIVFDHVPDAVTVLGIAIVCAAGLYTFHRERVRRAEARR